MTADIIDLTVPLPGRHALRENLLKLDFRLFETAATRHWPGAERVLPRLSRSANHGVLWFATAAALAATGSPGPAGPPSGASPPSPWPPRRSTRSASAPYAAPGPYWTPCRWSGS